MRKTTILLSMMVLAAMVLAACGGGATSTNVSPTQLPVTSVATEPSTATEMPTEAATEAPVVTETPGIPVTGAEAGPAGRMSERLKFQVLDQTGAKLGTVSDLVLDLSKAKVVYVIVNAGANKVAVPRDLFMVQSATSPGTGTGLATSTPGGGGTGSATSTPSAGGAGTGSATSTPAGVATGQTGTGSATSTPSAGGAGTGTGSAMGKDAFIFQGDPTMLQNAPAFNDKNMPGLGQAPDSWDIAIRNFWKGGGVTSGNTPSPAGTAVTDTPAATGGGTGLSTATPSAGGAGTVLSTSTPSVPVTGGGAATGQGALSIQGVVLASQVIGAKVTVGMQALVPPSTGGTSSATSTPSAGGTGSATSTPSAGGGSPTSTPSAGSATSTPSAGGAGTGTGPGTTANVNATIADLLVDNSGTILFIVLRTTANAGALIPVPLRFLQLDSDNNFVLNIDPTMLQNAPSFQNSQFPDMSTPGWDSQFQSFWQSSGTGGGPSATATP